MDRGSLLAFWREPLDASKIAQCVTGRGGRCMAFGSSAAALLRSGAPLGTGSAGSRRAAAVGRRAGTEPTHLRVASTQFLATGSARCVASRIRPRRLWRPAFPRATPRACSWDPCRSAHHRIRHFPAAPSAGQVARNVQRRLLATLAGGRLGEGAHVASARHPATKSRGAGDVQQ